MARVPPCRRRTHRTARNDGNSVHSVWLPVLHPLLYRMTPACIFAHQNLSQTNRCVALESQCRSSSSNFLMAREHFITRTMRTKLCEGRRRKRPCHHTYCFDRWRMTDTSLGFMYSNEMVYLQETTQPDELTPPSTVTYGLLLSHELIQCHLLVTPQSLYPSAICAKGSHDPESRLPCSAWIQSRIFRGNLATMQASRV